MKKRIISVILSLAFMVGMGTYTSTHTWFSSGTEKHQIFSSGKLAFKVDGALKQNTDDSIIEPGVELVDESNPIILTNTSTIDCQIRVKISCQYYISGNTNVQTFKYTSNDDENSMLEIEFQDGWAAAEGATDGYYYYNGVGTDGSIIKPDVNVQVIKSIKYNGKNTTIENNGKELNVIITVQARQAYFVTWTDLGTILG